MNEELVKRLRNIRDEIDLLECTPLLDEAADAIERLTKERDEARADAKNAMQRESDAWRHAAARSLAVRTAVRVICAAWRASAERSLAFATESPETPEQWRAYGSYETDLAHAEELDNRADDRLKDLSDRAMMPEQVRPMHGFAPGYYNCQCVVCGKTFEGDKRAFQCASCARIAAATGDDNG